MRQSLKKIYNIFNTFFMVILRFSLFKRNGLDLSLSQDFDLKI